MKLNLIQQSCMMEIKQTKSKPCNQLIEHLKSQGLYLTQQKIVKLPPCINPAPSMITRIKSIISSQQRVYDLKSPKKIWPLYQNLLLITHCNTLSLYTLSKTPNQSIEVQFKQKIHLEEMIDHLVFSHSQNLNNLDVVYFLTVYKNWNLISLFSFKNKGERQIVLQNQVKISGNVMTLQFISFDQLLIVTSKHIIEHYKIQKYRLKRINQMNQLKSMAKLNQNEILMFVKLLARPREQQDSLIAMFYGTWNSQTNKCQLCIKEMFREMDGNLVIKDPIYVILSFTSIEFSDFKKDKSRDNIFYNKEIFKDVQVINQKDYFLLQIQHQIFVITKHFDKYVRLDAITLNFSSFKILMLQHHVPLICCIGLDTMELWHITVDAKKSHCTLMDVINLIPGNKLKENQFLRFWVTKYQGKIQTIFAFDKGPRQISFFGVKKIDKVSKLVNKLMNTSSKNQIVKAQQLGKKLGVDRKSLYLRLWNQNQKNPANICLYLIQCHDLQSIHSELEKYMRRKFILTGELVKIHKEIEIFLLQKLEKQLDLQTLKWFLKTNFQKRKLKLFQFNTQITFKEFHEIYSMSLFDLIDKMVLKQLKPEQQQKQKKLWNLERPKEPIISVDHILQEFKLAILQNYESFLLTLLQSYKYNSVSFFQNFPDFLPKVPLQINVLIQSANLNAENAIINLGKDKTQNQDYGDRDMNLTKNGKQTKNFQQINEYKQSRAQNQLKLGKQAVQGKGKQNKDQWQRKKHTKSKIHFQTISQTTLPQKPQKPSSSQKIWFSDITIQQWAQQEGSVDYIFKHMYPHYQTHQIINLITQLTESDWNKKNKYLTHCLITSTLNTFRQKIYKIQGLNLYLSVCQFLNRVKFDSLNKLNNQSMVKDLLQYICKQSHIQNVLPQKHSTEIYDAANPDFMNKSESDAAKILSIMKQKKLLSSEGYETCLLYSKMHDLMISKQIMDPQTTIVDLMTKSHPSLIAAFFIGKRQRNAEIFNDLFPLYSNKLQFYDSLKDYINSASCSRVELEILVKELRQIKFENEDYNNYLSELLIQGFCQRTQIREKYEAHEIVLMFTEIQLNLDLALKIQKFLAIKDQLTFIFELFMCEKLTYLQVLNCPQTVIRLMMQNYFNSNLNWEVLKNYDMQNFTIEGKEVDLDIIENTYSVVLYLREIIYVELSELDISLIYGYIMIEWQQFDALRTIFSEDEKLQESLFTSNEYFEKLILNALSQIYSRENIYMDEKTVIHIQNILSLMGQDNTNQITVKQRAKIQLSKLLEDWGYTTQTVTLQLICIKWRQDHRQELIIQIMDKCIQYFDLESLQKLYLLLQTTRIGNALREVRNSESIRLAYCLAEKLDIYANQVKSGMGFDNKEEEISKIIYFINKGQTQYVAQFGLMAKSFLRMVVKKYTHDPKMIEEDLRSEFMDLKRQDLIRQQTFSNQNNNFLSVNRITSQMHKSFSHSGQNGNMNNSKDKSYIKDKSYRQDQKSSYSKISAKEKANQAKEDPISGMKFDDPLVLQRVFNNIFRAQNTVQISNIQTDLTQQKVWYHQGKQIIEYFVLNWSNPQTINEMFRNKFSREIWTETEKKQITVNKEFYFKIQQSIQEPLNLRQSQKLWNVNLELQDLWQISLKASQNLIHHYIQILKHRVKQFIQILSQKFCKVLYYGHFFLLMALKYPQTLTKLNGIDYEHIVNLQIIYELEMLGKSKKQEFKKINFEAIWRNYYIGLKRLIIAKIQQSQPQTKIPQNLENKVIERLIKEVSKQKAQLSLYMKILTQIQQYISKYLKQSKPKILNQLKILIQSMIFQSNLGQTQLNQKKSSKQKRRSSHLRISLRQVQQAKDTIKQHSQQDLYTGDGLMKEIADVFEDFKKSQNLEDYNDSLKEIIIKKIMSKRQLNISSFLGDNNKSDNNMTPFNSSIVLQNKVLNDQNISKRVRSPIKPLQFDKKNKNLSRNSSSELEYFKSQNFQYDSLIDIESEDDKQVSDYENVLEVIQSFDGLLIKSQLPYLKFLYPQDLCKALASKDLKFQKKYHILRPVTEDVSTQIKEFAKYLNGFEVYSAKKSKYYVEENVKKMLPFGQDNIIQIIQQLYFDEDSILVTLNPKQLEANALRQSKGLGSQQQKYKKAKFSFILGLLKSLQLGNGKGFEIFMKSVQKSEQDFVKLQLKLGRDEVEKMSVSFRDNVHEILPLSDLICQGGENTLATQIEWLFGRVYLSNTAIRDDFQFEVFRFMVEFLEGLLNNLVEEAEKEQQNTKSINYSQQDTKNYMYCMLALQIIKLSDPSDLMKQKFDYLTGKMSKQFIIQHHQFLSQLLQNNNELKSIFNIKVITFLNN